jgi:hypothetical protein
VLGSADTLMIASRDGGVTVDGATVVKTDIAATNGVIHVIGSVILPKENRAGHGRTSPPHQPIVSEEGEVLAGHKPPREPSATLLNSSAFSRA